METEKTMTSIRFSDTVRRWIDILSAEEGESMTTILNRAVEYYYAFNSIERLWEMIYEYEGRIGASTNLVNVLLEGNTRGALQIIKAQKPEGKAAQLLEMIKVRVDHLT